MLFIFNLALFFIIFKINTTNYAGVVQMKKHERNFN